MKTDINWSQIKLCPLSSTQMRQSGFWDIAETRWFYYKYNSLLNLTFFFIIFKNKKSFKIKLIDNETKMTYSITDLSKISYKNKKEEDELNNFLNEIYQDFFKKGLIKGE